ncbi:hypothetical protein F5B22DRAFT_658295 [Xylaria bambusicola]|uniref:uncharacterized protein n=1 Tax=Xylaria bambusicola TaxID=326684 RepID=UPI0020075FFB|nr:uncharacterized protein F5B22DRAFT_658295 [Xylaria bambusicola]KAI0525457.1 hypothetical protein F5B22DRAFT_658295 [Xylaria bambusicola]
MAEFTNALRKYNNSFFRIHPSSIPAIVCVFIGGSRLYAQAQLQSDFDGIIVLNSKHEIYTLVADKRNRQCLWNLIGVETEDKVDLCIPSPSSPLYNEFDAIRLSGLDENNIKRTITLLSLEYFTHRKSSLNILSGEDQRVYTDISGSAQLCQATTLENAVILHDQWLYASETVVRFGITTDLLLSAACVYGERPYGQGIKCILAKHYTSVAEASPRAKLFAKSPFFVPSYTKWLDQELAGILPTNFTPSFNRIEVRCDHALLFGDTAQTRANVGLCDSTRATQLSLEAVRLFNKGEFSRRDGHQPQFSNNSSSYIARTKSIDTTFDIFVKQTPFAQDELRGAVIGAEYFPRMSIPWMVSSGELLYRFFPGRTASDVRLSYIRGERKDSFLLEKLLYTELVKAGDTLRAYRSSLSLERNSSAHRCNIQRFFHDRLLENRRVQAHYGHGISLGGQTISLDRLLSLRWLINGTSYPSLYQAYKEASDIISPTSAQILSCPTVFGLGDAHGGNVMIDESSAKGGGTSDILFIDYEVAGFHPVMLDLAKPLYNDLFYEMLYRRLTPSCISLGLKYTLDMETNTVILDMKPQIDNLTQALLDIKLRYLIKPLCDELRFLGANLEDHVPLLSTSLFLCATLGLSLASNEEAFLANFASGLMIQGAQTWRELALRLEELGFQARVMAEL